MNLSHWRLAAKFNLVFVFVFTLSILIAGAIFNSILQQQARTIVINQAKLMMENALAVRNYTSKQIKPVLPVEHNGRFVPQTVPAYSAQKAFAYLRQQYPQFYYKEATLNPTNPNDRVEDWERLIVNRFRKEKELKEVVGVRDTTKGQYLYLSRPLRITDKNCLQCHSTPAKAPAVMIKDYGSRNGFGWKMNEVVGAQVVSVPIGVPQSIARRITYLMMGSLAAVLLLTLVILNVMLQFIVVDPVKKLAKAADEISKGNIEVDDLPVNGEDEIATLSGSFNRMLRSLKQAIKMLDGA